MTESLLAYLRDRGGRAVSFKELANGIGLKPSEKRAFKQALKSLVESGEIKKIRRNQYALPARPQAVEGRFGAHKDGFGFVVPREGASGDIFIPAADRSDAMHGDLVRAAVEPNRRRGWLWRGRIVAVLERAVKNVVGRYERVARAGFLCPLDPRLGRQMMVSPKSALEARSGQYVAAEVVRYPALGRLAEVRITDIIGEAGQQDTLARLMLSKYSIDQGFSARAAEEAEEVAQGADERALKGRLNLKRLLAFTIDPEDAKDHDDAVSISKTPGGLLRVGVHIADVGHYVVQNGAIDLEARKKSTSVYMPGCFVPMLPTRLSSDICSLKECEPRLAISVLADFTPQGELKEYSIVPSVIQSKARLTYKEASTIIAGDNRGVEPDHYRLRGKLKAMENLALTLRRKRMAQGSLDFDLPEAHIVMGSDGSPEDVAKVDRTTAHMIVEEFMLAANQVVAMHLEGCGYPLIYRVHERPNPEKIAYFGKVVSALGYNIKVGGGGVKSKTLQKVLDAARDKPEAPLINSLLLRSMKQARYSAYNLGHYGLGFKLYTHFTSPIRRYPDLVVHRLLKRALIEGEPSPRPRLKVVEELEATAAHASEKERLAAEAEREMESIKKAQFMADKIGRQFGGLISRVSNSGINVELVDFFVEGFVPRENLGRDYYELVENGFALAGRRSGAVYRIGDAVRVIVEKAIVETAEIEFSLLNR